MELWLLFYDGYVSALLGAEWGDEELMADYHPLHQLLTDASLGQLCTAVGAWRLVGEAVREEQETVDIVAT